MSQMTSFSLVMVTPHSLEYNAGFHLHVQGRQGESFLQQTHTLLSCSMHQHTHTPATHYMYMYDTCTPSTTTNHLHVQPHQKFITPQQPPPPPHTHMHGERTHTSKQHNTACLHQTSSNRRQPWKLAISRGSTNRAFHWTTARAPHTFLPHTYSLDMEGRKGQREGVIPILVRKWKGTQSSVLCCSSCFANYSHNIIHTQAIKAGRLNHPTPNSQPLIMNNVIILSNRSMNNIMQRGHTCKQPHSNRECWQCIPPTHTHKHKMYLPKEIHNKHT